MKQFKTLLAQLLVISSLLLPWATAAALEDFSANGVISKIGISSFSLYHGDAKYRVTPTVKIAIPGVQNAKLGNLKVGDVVSIEGHKIGGRNYVEIIVYYNVDDE